MPRRTKGRIPITPPIEPMLAKLADALPEGGNLLFEPKWDGFRAIVFRGAGDVYIQSRDLKPLDRYFPDLHQSLLDLLPDGCVVDGEIVIATPNGLDFDALQLRLHPAQSRAAKLARETPASFVAFDALAVEGNDIMAMPQGDRRANLDKLLKRSKSPLYVTPMTTEHRVAVDWLRQFEGAGLDGVVAGFRWYKDSTAAVGSLLLGLYDDAGSLHHVGVTSAFTMAARKDLAQ